MSTIIPARASAARPARLAVASIAPPQVGAARAFWWLAVAALVAPLAVAAMLALSGCATVKDYQREYLADPIMAFDRDAREESRELHWREAREGSTGGIGAAGGGCACN